MALENGIKQVIEGDSLDECKRKLFEMYQNNYNIEKRETIFKHTGFFGLKQKEVQRITYTVNNRKAYDVDNYYAYSNNSRDSESERLEKSRQEIIQKQSSVLLNNQMQQMASKIDELNKQISTMNSAINISTSEKHETIQRIEELLEENEFSFSYIRMIEEKIRGKFSLDQLEDFKLVERNVVDWIGESIQIASERIFRPPHVIIIVGPTGVGKTTTIAKMASNTILDAKKNNQMKPNICLLTIDTMRVGAQEQLTKFGDILEKAVLKAESVNDVRKIYEDNKEHVDYIFIDTSGYSPNDATHISEMKNMLDVKMNPDIYLSVCASTKCSDLQNIFRNYEPFAYESVIITKCDETEQIGNVISVLWDRHKSVSYITDGQRVPRNIRKASVIDFLKLLTGFDIDRVHIEDKFGTEE